MEAEKAEDLREENGGTFVKHEEGMVHVWARLPPEVKVEETRGGMTRRASVGSETLDVRGPGRGARRITRLFFIRGAASR